MNKINLQAYHAAIKKKTVKILDEFKQLAEKKGFIINGRFNQEIEPCAFEKRFSFTVKS